MNLNQLYYFATLARVEHYTKAAEMLSITQPSLSHAISVLEQELGTSLFEKRGRNVALTKYGKVFLEYVNESLAILDSGVKKMRSFTSETSGIIDLAYIYTLGSVFVPQLVGEFLKRHEDWNIEFHFYVGSTSEIIKGLKEEKYDIAFCSSSEDEPEIVFWPIGKEKLVVVVPKDHELAGRRAVALSETLKYPHICFPKSCGLRIITDELLEKAGGKPVIAYEIEEDNSMAGLVAAGFGIAIMPQTPLLNGLAVDVLEIKEPSYERLIYMAMMKNKFQIPIVKYFVEYVEETLVAQSKEL
ncbi:MAG: LysR family transcriptional regulator [Bariatricus sp.]|nr:LysR family transcriptional regulator [Bariatricus sp.]